MIPTKYKKFQEDLQKGMTLTKACQKHQITIKDAFKTLQYHQKATPPKHKPKWDVTVERNILKKKKGYTINKNDNGERKNFGTYHTLSDAKKVRTYMEKNGWTNNIDKACHILKIRRKTRGRY